MAHKERYIKIKDSYFPMDSTGFEVHKSDRGVELVSIYNMSEDGNALTHVYGEEALHLIALLDEISFDLDLIGEYNG